MKEKRLYIATLIFDILIIGCSIFGVLAALFDIRFMVDYARLAKAPFLTTFTGLSNLFIGLVAIVTLIFRIKDKKIELPLWLYLIKLSSVSMIMITCLTTICYLTPSAGSEWWRLYINSNIFNHAINPLLALVAFIIFEKKMNFGFINVLYTLIPLLVYEIFYLIRALPNYDPSQEVDLYYDVYGVMRFGALGVILFFIGFLVFGFGLSTALYFINKAKK